MAHWHTVSLNKNKLRNIKYIGYARARVRARYHINGAIGIPKMTTKSKYTWKAPGTAYAAVPMALGVRATRKLDRRLVDKVGRRIAKSIADLNKEVA